MYTSRLPRKPSAKPQIGLSRIPTRRSFVERWFIGPLLLSLVVALATAPTVNASDSAEEAKPTLEITAVSVSPDHPAPDTLCSLAVEISNSGPQPASQLAFEVRVAGHELPIYRNQIFMQALPPGKTTKVDLYNFWTT
ncbi:MAG: hypothetical protein K8J08_12675, partial [Thermoanaerobaculia bacterium]|nr:hypothetical protein [Thermoanaerobaculia bacterium]